MINNFEEVKNIINLVRKIAPNRSYIRITKYKKFFFVAIDDFSDPMIFDNNGIYTGKNFVEIKSEDLKNPIEIYYKAGG